MASKLFTFTFTFTTCVPQHVYRPMHARTHGMAKLPPPAAGIGLCGRRHRDHENSHLLREEAVTLANGPASPTSIEQIRTASRQFSRVNITPG